MKTKISTFLDGELDRFESTEVIDALKVDAVARETWRLYHLISDALRDTVLRTEGFSARFSERLAAEPTVLAPGRPSAERGRWVALSAAASVAAVALVGWLAFAPTPELRPDATPGLPLASAPRTAVAVQPAQPAQPASTPTLPPAARQAVVVQRESALTQLPLMPAQTANDYLFAHQEFSPSMSLRGVAPYVRTVSAPVREGGRR